MSLATRRGRPPHPDVLTPAEWRIVHMVRHGMTNATIAAGRGISLDAVKAHVASAIAKLGLENRKQLKHWVGAPFDSALSRSTDMTSTTLELGRIGQIARNVSDTKKAEAWYRDVLGLKHLYTFPSRIGDLVFFDCGGTRLLLEMPAEGPLRTQSLLYFLVPDINAAFEELKGRGIEFIDAPHMIFKHPDGTEEWMVFFKDCDDQMLALISQPKP